MNSFCARKYPANKPTHKCTAGPYCKGNCKPRAINRLPKEAAEHILNDGWLYMAIGARCWGKAYTRVKAVKKARIFNFKACTFNFYCVHPKTVVDGLNFSYPSGNKPIHLEKKVQVWLDS